MYRLGDAMTSAMELDYKGANQKFEGLLQAYPSEPNVHFRYGALLNIQDSDRGIEEIKKAVETRPGPCACARRPERDLAETGEYPSRAGVRRAGG